MPPFRSGSSRLWLRAAAALLALPCTLAAAGLLAGLGRADQGPVAAGFSNPPAPASMAEQAMGGERGPFYPSALSTRGGGVLPAQATPPPQACGGSGCHSEIVAAWSSSAHRFSGLDNPWYRKTYEEMKRQAGAVPARWCSGCHTPGLLTAGLEQPNEAMSAAAAAVSCTACHLVSRVNSSMGQADSELEAPPPGALAASPDGRELLDPRLHRRTYGKPLLATAELCSTCHKAAADRPVNGGHFLNVMNDYDPWQANSSSGQGITQSIHFPEPRTCADCHMPLIPSKDPAARGGRIHSHRFAAANTGLPALHGDAEQLRQVIEYLKAGQVGVDIFAMGKGRPPGAGPESRAERLEHLYAPLNRLRAAVRRGESTRFDVVLRTHGVGHLFPAGKNVFKDCWVELKAVDSRGRTVFWSGKADESCELDPGAHRVSSLWVDVNGQPVEGYEVWKSHARIYTQAVEPNTGFVVRFRVPVPADAGDMLTLTARVQYRKFRLAFTRWVFAGDARAPRLPIVTMAEDSLTLPVVAADAELPDMSRAQAEPETTEAEAERWTDYGYGLAARGDLPLSRKVLQKLVALRPADLEARTTLGNIEWALGDRGQARATFDRVLASRPGHARAHFYLGLLERDESRYDHALEHLRAAAAAFPHEALIWKEIGRISFMSADFKGAAEAFDRALAIEPQDSAIHLMMSQAQRALGNAERSQRHQRLFEQYRPSSEGGRAIGVYLEKEPLADVERRLFHEHGSVPLEGTDRPAAGHGE